MSEQAMLNAGIEVKVEDYDGTYVCLFCGESVRGQPALKCSHCSSNPFHLACVALAHSKYAEVCPTCDRKTVEAWGRASGGTVEPSEIIDLREVESEGEGAAEVAALTGNGARAEAVPAVVPAAVSAAITSRRRPSQSCARRFARAASQCESSSTCVAVAPSVGGGSAGTAGDERRPSDAKATKPCPRCTFANSFEATQCEMCEAHLLDVVDL